MGQALNNGLTVFWDFFWDFLKSSLLLLPGFQIPSWDWVPHFCILVSVILSCINVLTLTDSGPPWKLSPLSLQWSQYQLPPYNCWQCNQGLLFQHDSQSKKIQGPWEQEQFPATTAGAGSCWLGSGWTNQKLLKPTNAERSQVSPYYHEPPQEGGHSAMTNGYMATWSFDMHLEYQCPKIA